MKKKSSTTYLKSPKNEKPHFKSASKFAKLNREGFKPKGFKIYTFNAGFKKKYDDLLIIIFDQVVNSANFYSKTSMPSAPIIWDKKYNRGKVKGLIVNAGNANAHTGDKGLRIIDQYVESLSKKINCKKNEILVSSTGVIGELFDPKLIIKQILQIDKQKNKNLFQAAKAIMTTDTYPKIVSKKIVINNKNIKIYGIAKGSGMIMPNMATMLVYIFVEANLTSTIMKKLINNNLENTFNSISVDSDTSTSDTLVMFSINNNSININNKKKFQILDKGVHNVMKDLALKVVKDGEGLSKFIVVNIFKSKNIQQAKKIGLSIVNSPLVKTAMAGEDANWGRVIMAIGKTEEKIDQNKIKVSFGKYLLCENGSINKKINYSMINKYMKNKSIEINVELNSGVKNHTVYGNDLTYKYVSINGDYRS